MGHDVSTPRHIAPRIPLRDRAQRLIYRIIDPFVRLLVRLGVTPEINAVCTILIAVVATGVIAASIVNKRREVQRRRDEQEAQRANNIAFGRNS